MADLNNLSLTEASELERDATTFATHASNLQTTTRNMLQIVRDSNQVWSGDAQCTYAQQFSGLEDDMSYIFDMVKEYCDDLNKIAQNYRNAENANVEEASSLKIDVDLIKI